MEEDLITKIREKLPEDWTFCVELTHEDVTFEIYNDMGKRIDYNWPDDAKDCEDFIMAILDQVKESD